jgi:hypothetical protein
MDAANAPYSIKSPTNWTQVAAYSRGQPVSQLSREMAQETFDQLLRNIRLENCTFFSDVVNALFHRVPGRVQAENYGHDGVNKSYFVSDRGRKSKFYRTSEPVPVEQIQTSGDQWHSEQAIRLGSGEWTAYTIESETTKNLVATVRVKVEAAPAEFDLGLNDNTRKVELRQMGWTELKLKPVEFAKGTNRLTLGVISGVIAFDWVDFR